MTFEVQVPTGKPGDGKLVTVMTTSPTRESALAFALRRTESIYNLRQFVEHTSTGAETRKYTLLGDNRVAAFVTRYE